MSITQLSSEREKVFLVDNLIEVHISESAFNRLSREHALEDIISYLAPRELRHHITGRELRYITRESGIPLLGHLAFGLIDRGTSLIQVRPVTGCNLCCVFCSVGEGPCSRTRVSDYIVDVGYLLEEFRKLAEFKGGGVEAHIDGQGEPFLYPYTVDLIRGLSAMPEVATISVQTNGVPLTGELIRQIEPYVTRINLSINSMNPELARRMSGVRDYDLGMILETARIIADSDIDLLISPLWLRGWNDDDIPKLIEFALEIGAGQNHPPLGIQKFVAHRYGRHPRHKGMSFKVFYDRLSLWEKEYGVKLIIKPEDFGMESRKRYERKFKRNERIQLELVAPGRMKGEMLAVSRERALSVITNKREGKRVNAKITRVRDEVYLAREI